MEAIPLADMLDEATSSDPDLNADGLGDSEEGEGATEAWDLETAGEVISDSLARTMRRVMHEPSPWPPVTLTHVVRRPAFSLDPCKVACVSKRLSPLPTWYVPSFSIQKSCVSTLSPCRVACVWKPFGPHLHATNAFLKSRSCETEARRSFMCSCARNSQAAMTLAVRHLHAVLPEGETMLQEWIRCFNPLPPAQRAMVWEGSVFLGPHTHPEDVETLRTHHRLTCELVTLFFQMHTVWPLLQGAENGREKEGEERGEEAHEIRLIINARNGTDEMTGVLEQGLKTGMGNGRERPRQWSEEEALTFLDEYGAYVELEGVVKACLARGWQAAIRRVTEDLAPRHESMQKVRGHCSKGHNLITGGREERREGVREGDSWEGRPESGDGFTPVSPSVPPFHAIWRVSLASLHLLSLNVLSLSC